MERDLSEREEDGSEEKGMEGEGERETDQERGERGRDKEKASRRYKALLFSYGYLTFSNRIAGATRYTRESKAKSLPSPFRGRDHQRGPVIREGPAQVSHAASATGLIKRSLRPTPPENSSRRRIMFRLPPGCRGSPPTFYKTP